jgi:hypothetical protein
MVISEATFHRKLTDWLAVVEEGASGGPQERWARLRRLGLADTKEVRHLALRLKGAHIHLKQIESEMKILVEDAKAGHGMEQVRRYVKAEKEYADCRRRISAWLKGEEINPEPSRSEA